MHRRAGSEDDGSDSSLEDASERDPTSATSPAYLRKVRNRGVSWRLLGCVQRKAFVFGLRRRRAIEVRVNEQGSGAGERLLRG